MDKQEIKSALDELVWKGYLKKNNQCGGVTYQDSDEVTKLLKQGKTRKEIETKLENRFKQHKNNICVKCGFYAKDGNLSLHRVLVHKKNKVIS